MSGHAAQDEEVRQNVDHIDGFQPAIDADCQALMRELVDHVEHAVLSPIMGSILHEVVRPDVIAALRPKPDARSVMQPQTTAFGLLLGNLQPLTPPDPLDPLVVDDPTGLIPQHPRNLAIAVAAILSGQFNDVGSQPLFRTPWHLALRRAMLADVQVMANMLDTGTPARGA